MTSPKKNNFKKSSLIITSAIVGSLALVAFAPAAYAFGPGGNQGQKKFNQMHQNSHAQGQMQRGGKNAQRGNKSGFLKFACSDEAADKLDTMLSKMSEKFELTNEQEGLYDDFKTAALTAQTNFADNCSSPKADVAEKDDANIVMRLNVQRHNMAATVTALDEVLPELEAFFDSLSDEQKAAMKKQGPNMQGHNMQGQGSNN